MTQLTISRSVLHTSTVEFKRHFREYLKTLAKDIDTNRVELIEALEWCFDRWEYWRQKFYPDAELMFPFFQSGRRGSEFGHYSTCGSSGQPSVIHIKRSFLMGTSDITVAKLSPTKKLVLLKDHPDRLTFVDQTILHELLPQYLHEASPSAAEYESSESGKNYKGHGPLFAAECNRINETLHPELGFEFVPVRHMKRSHAKVNDVQRPSCAHFTHGELFHAWDITNPDLLGWQIEENRQRLEQALAFYGGAVELVEEAAEVATDFPAPFDSSCAEVCHQQLLGYDQEKDTDLVTAFHLAVLQQMQAAGTLDELLDAIGHSTAPADIRPASRQQMALVEDKPVAIGWRPAEGDWIHVDGYDDKVFVVQDIDGDRLWVTAVGEPGGNWMGPVSDADVCKASTVPTSVDSRLPALTQEYPISDPVASLKRLEADITAAGGKAALCKNQFGLKDGSSLSRHQKALKAAIAQLVAA